MTKNLKQLTEVSKRNKYSDITKTTSTLSKFLFLNLKPQDSLLILRVKKKQNGEVMEYSIL